MNNNLLHENLSRINGGKSVLLLYDGQEPEFPLHWHDYVEIIYIVHGKLNVTVADKTYVISDNQLLFIPPRELHKIHTNNRPVTILLQYDPVLVSHIASLNNIHFTNPHILSVMDLQDPSAFQQIYQRLLNIHELYNNGEGTLENPHNDYFVDARMAILLTEFLIQLNKYEMLLAQQKVSDLTSVHSDTIQRMMEACSYIAHNCTVNLSLEDVASYVGFSKYYFSRVFKKYTGNSFVDYLAKCRISKAKSLFSNSQMNIAEIAMQSGFGSIASFNRVFQKAEGCAPSEFRSLHHYLEKAY